MSVPSNSLPSRPRPSISLCAIVKNEQQCIGEMLQSVQGIVAEMIVVDTGSTDNTIDITKRYGAVVLSVPWEDDFAKARNAGLALATGQWILFLDADEQLDLDDHAELCRCASHLEYDAFFLQVHNHLNRARNGATVNPILRMFKNAPEHRFEGAIHEQISASILRHHPDAQFHVTNVKIHHYGYTPEIVMQKSKHTRNFNLLQKELNRDPSNPFYLYNIGIEYWRVGQVAEAQVMFQQAREQLSPQTNYTHLVLKCEASCLAALGRFSDAINLCRVGEQMYENYTDLYHYEAAFLARLGLFERAKVAAVQAIQVGSPNGLYHTEEGMGTYLTWCLLGSLHEATHDFELAVNCYREAVRLQEDLQSAWRRIFGILRCTNVALKEAERMTVQSALDPVKGDTIEIQDSLRAQHVSAKQWVQRCDNHLVATGSLEKSGHLNLLQQDIRLQLTDLLIPMRGLSEV